MCGAGWPGLSEGPKGRAERSAACEIGKERQSAFSWLTAVLAEAGMGLIREPGAGMIPVNAGKDQKKDHKQIGFYFNKQKVCAAFEFRFIIRRLLFREILLCGSDFRRCKKEGMFLFFSCWLLTFEGDIRSKNVSEESCEPPVRPLSSRKFGCTPFRSVKTLVRIFVPNFWNGCSFTERAFFPMERWNIW